MARDQEKLSAQDQDPNVIPVCLRTEDDSGLVACAWSSPRLSWKLSARRAGVVQTAYQLELSNDNAFADCPVAFDVVESARPFFAPWPSRPLRSREVKWWRVRVRTERGWTAWSEPCRIEGSLYDHSDWVARPVSPRSNVGRLDRSPPCLLRREFDVDACASARIYVSALGVCNLRINGKAVTGDLLEPGWTDHYHRTLFAVYDILPLLRQGRNCIAAELSDGWWRGELGWMGQRGHYGDTTALLVQIEISGPGGERQILASDETWRGSYGAMQLAELYDGTDTDLRLSWTGWDRPGFNDAEWEPVVELDLPPGLEQRAMPAIQVLQSFEPAWSEHIEGTIRIDAGQNLAGFLRLQARGPRGAKIQVRHAEMRMQDGSLYLAPLRNARAADNYILRGNPDTEQLVPSFTFHGFRYAEVVCDPGVEITSVDVVQIGSALNYSGRFQCSDEDINTLFENSVRSQKANFISLPTDCPQRDERLGWTGDIQVFSETACLNADARSFLSSWLRDLATEQRPDGNVPSVVPNVIKGHEFEFGGVGWGDAATLVPWTLFRIFDDEGVLERQYPSMRAWVDYAASRLNAEGLWLGDFHLGDWLDPGAPPDRPHQATTDRDFIATSYLSHSAQCLAKAADLLGRRADAETYGELSQRVAASAWRRWAESAQTTQAGCAIAIMFGIAPEEEVASVGRRLADLVDASGGRIATGFLGTPLVLPALSRAGQDSAAYRLLFNRKCPGWLYQVDRGATTMWERWDAVGEDGRLHAGTMSTNDANSMISFNHYAYGAVSSWLYQAVAGLAPETPGFARIRFEPRPGGGISWASASLETGYGHAAIRWDRVPSGLMVDITVPPGSTATFRCPEGFTCPDGARSMDVGSGQHRIDLTPAN